MDDVKAGQVVIFPFPFNNATEVKPRPTLVLSATSGENFIGCMISTADIAPSVAITRGDFVKGGIPLPVSYILPLRVSTLLKDLATKQVGQIHHSKLKEAISILMAALGK